MFVVLFGDAFLVEAIKVAVVGTYTCFVVFTVFRALPILGFVPIIYGCCFRGFLGRFGSGWLYWVVGGPDCFFLNLFFWGGRGRGTAISGRRDRGTKANAFYSFGDVRFSCVGEFIHYSVFRRFFVTPTFSGASIFGTNDNFSFSLLMCRFATRVCISNLGGTAICVEMCNSSKANSLVDVEYMSINGKLSFFRGQ